MGFVKTPVTVSAVLWGVTLAGFGQAPPGPTGSSATPKIVITKPEADRLFGGRPAKMLLRVSPERRTSIAYLIDFSKPTLELAEVCRDMQPHESTPMISPDGRRVADYVAPQHNAKKRNEDRSTAQIFVRHLEPGGPGKTLVAKGFDPRWWVHPKTGDEYILFVSNEWDNGTDITGTTFIQKIKKGTCEPEGPAKVLIEKYAFRDGRSPNGRYISTSIPGGNIAEFADPLAVENAKVRVLNDEAVRTICNGAMPQNDALSGKFIFEDKGHASMHIGIPNSNDDQTVPLAAGHGNIQVQEWSTHPDYVVARLGPGKKKNTTVEGYAAFVLHWPSKQWRKVTEGCLDVHLWVEK